MHERSPPNSPNIRQAEFSEPHISRNALQVVSELHKAGFEAYIVGGCIRDLMLGLKPKDFDVATSATPEEIKQVFRNCRLIGRRFRLAHIRFGRELIEVATFRASQQNTPMDSETKALDTPKSRAQTNAHGMLVRDNVFGNVEEDAIRRDFTVNALYYEPVSGSVIDHTKRAFEDFENKQLSLIGDPETRYREDPVRMIRAIRFMAKLAFSLEEASEKPIKSLAPLLSNIPPARLFEEVLKLFQNGKAHITYTLLRQYELFKFLFPLTEKFADDNQPFGKMIELALKNTDIRIAAGKPVTPAFLYAVFLWRPVLNRLEQLMGKKNPLFPTLTKASHQILQEQGYATSIPKRHVMAIREIWELQYRLPKRGGKRADALMAHPRFRAAYDFLLLREECGELEPGLGDWWTKYQERSSSERSEMLENLPDSARRRPRRKKRAGSNN